MLKTIEELVKETYLEVSVLCLFFQAYQIFQDYRPAGYYYLFLKPWNKGFLGFQNRIITRAKRITQHFKSISTGAQYVTPDSKFIVKKSKCAGLAQEIGSSAPTSCSLPWLANGAT